jgi:hypothetical protein
LTGELVFYLLSFHSERLLQMFVGSQEKRVFMAPAIHLVSFPFAYQILLIAFGVLAPCLIFFNGTELFDRYRTSNLIISAMTPGPVEPNSEQLQNYLKVIVDDLVMLYQHGILISTPQFPNGKCVRILIFYDLPSHHPISGRRIQVVLIGVICDHPAMFVPKPIRISMC